MSVRRWGRPDEAEEWCREALALWEELGDKTGLATTYHELGVIALVRDRLDEAERWLGEALATWQELGDEPSMSMTFGNIGVLALKRGQLDQALEWTVRCVTVHDEFPHPATQPGPVNLVALTKALGIDALEETWRNTTRRPLPQAVREYVDSGGGQHAG
jgi:tetratricopeptide (TPR) repeat protein